MEEEGILAQINNKYESPSPVCPDMSGKPLGYESCIVAFLVLLGGIGICLILMVVECFSKWTKVNIPWLVMYDRRDKNLSDTLAKDSVANQILVEENKILWEEIKLLKEMLAEKTELL